MSTMIVTLAIDGAVVDPLGIKEAVSMDMEKYGGCVRVLRVDVREPEQLPLAANQKGG